MKDTLETFLEAESPNGEFFFSFCFFYLADVYWGVCFILIAVVNGLL
jgi:hypothetical protein